MIASSAGDFLDLSERSADSSFATVVRMISKSAELYTTLDPAVTSCLAAESVKAHAWPCGFTSPLTISGHCVNVLLLSRGGGEEGIGIGIRVLIYGEEGKERKV